MAFVYWKSRKKLNKSCKVANSNDTKHKLCFFFKFIIIIIIIFIYLFIYFFKADMLFNMNSKKYNCCTEVYRVLHQENGSHINGSFGYRLFY